MALKRLDKEHEYKVADDSTDIRGWKINDADGQKVGKVDGLLFDPADNEVRYAIAEIENRCVLIPVGMLDLEERDHEVLARGYTRDRLLALREYREADFNEAEERHHYMGHVPEHKEQSLDYRREHFRGQVPERIRLMEERLRRPATNEEIEISKRPETRPEHVSEPVKREELEFVGTEPTQEQIDLYPERGDKV